jgi:hypothetical protein
MPPAFRSGFRVPFSALPILPSCPSGTKVKVSKTRYKRNIIAAQAGNQDFFGKV